MKSQMIKKFVAVAVVGMLTVATSRVYAIATISLGADDSVFFATSGGVYLKDGSLVEMGQFSVSDATLSALVVGGTITPANYAILLSDFIPLNGTFAHFIGDGTTFVAGDANSGAIGAIYSGSNTAFASGPI